MVFGLNKKERKVPDLSRYDYYYQNKQQDEQNTAQQHHHQQQQVRHSYLPSQNRHSSYSDFHSANRRHASTASAQKQRAYSVTGHNDGSSYTVKNPTSNQITTTKTRSLVPPQKTRTARRPSNNSRSYSIKSQNSNTDQTKRLNSINSVGSKQINNTGRNHKNNGSRSNSITVQTTEIKDPNGKTQSITRKTVKRMNGFEYVETTTTTTTTVKKKSPMKSKQKSKNRNSEINRHFQEFSGDYIEEDGYTNIGNNIDDNNNASDVEDESPYEDEQKDVESVTEPDNNDFVDSVIEEENEIDIIEEENHGHDDENALFLADSGSDKIHKPHNLRALLMPKETPLEKDEDIVPLDNTSSISKFTEAREEESISEVNNKKNDKQVPVNGSSRNSEIPEQKKKRIVRASSVPSNLRSNNSSYSKLKPKASGSNLRKAHVPSEPKPKKKLTEEEMYAVAYEIARKKVYQNSGLSHPEMNGMQYANPQPPVIVEESKGMSKMAKRMSVRQKPVINYQEDHQRQNYEVSLDAYSQNSRKNSVASTLPTSLNSNKKALDIHKLHSNEKHAPPIKKTMTDEEMYAKALQIAQKRFNDDKTANSMSLSQPEPIIVQESATSSINKKIDILPSIEDNPPHAKVQSIGTEEYNEEPREFVPEASMAKSPMKHRLRKLSSVSLGKKTKNPEITSIQTNNEIAESPNKSKLKNVFNKVVQFSQENSGYQPPKKDRQYQEEKVAPDAGNEHNTNFVRSAFDANEEHEQRVNSNLQNMAPPPAVNGQMNRISTNNENTGAQSINYNTLEAPTVTAGSSNVGGASIKDSTMESVNRQNTKSSSRGAPPSINDSTLLNNQNSNIIIKTNNQAPVNSQAREYASVSNVETALNNSGQPINVQTPKTSKNDNKTKKKKSFFGKLFKH
ncbi:hypothetical protein TPHA_0C02040 [Tetrapisispora phaffii CBS 4417]|uniref:Uncharacterized protein n=1 Tax=Tetrapisispora phaffii (strain ATCC 24235 / CBS 4417 / NBRC 1672 / NRRL Y-8282 / UCD 70-5) TaxID=1071381 RepID=G8BRI3_TETPH|nr:hypothetical protein TPHA_0C02040 [Tetrapisispora phaffii CBS 4417]CCE62359.1 hypothetical protein TPHA_0C02040 [Tetrapisispora phaffii CBS 4417]